MSNTLNRALDGVREALERSVGEGSADWVSENFGGRWRDREVVHAMRLGSMSAQLAQALAKLRSVEDETW